jgi:UDP-N-acetylmuramate--alanine ligase
MSALAKLFAINGYFVSGSDALKNEETNNLAFFGIKTWVGADENREELFLADAVVYTDAIPNDHAELRRAKELKKRLYSRGELLQAVSLGFSSVAAIGGSHGKTTCTSMCAHIFKELNVPFTAHIGGEDMTFGNFYHTGTEYLLTEA